MARQKKNNKPKLPKAVKGLKEYVIKRSGIIAACIVSAALVVSLTAAFFQRSDYFRLRAVEVRGAAESSLAVIKNDILKSCGNRNIFSINIGAISDALKPKYPDASSITVKRVLPDKLLVDLKFRKPVALLGAAQVYPIDREGVILVNINSMKLKDFVVIKGVEPRLAGKAHKKNSSKNLALALDLLDEINRSRFLDKFRVRSIDASDIRSLSFSLSESGPVVIIGYEDFKERLGVLKDTLRDPRLMLDKINYIDVRFHDVAVSPK
jgi:cell division septal protein FtsQ